MAQQQQQPFNSSRGGQAARASSSLAFANRMGGGGMAAYPGSNGFAAGVSAGGGGGRSAASASSASVSSEVPNSRSMVMVSPLLSVKGGAHPQQFQRLPAGASPVPQAGQLRRLAVATSSAAVQAQSWN